jgi:23S rRNA pseudouridine2605 synthase
MEERLQKILARAGFGSRRSNEDLIVAGRVKVNGVVAELGSKADLSKDSISVDGQLLPKEQPKNIYIALHKPRGVLSDVDPNDPRPTVMDLVPKVGHLFSVGRLDLDSEGLILLTNDGDLANRLTHPRYGHEKEYRVNVGTRPDDQQLSTWRRGVVLPDGHKTAPAQVIVDSTSGEHTWLRVILKEGRKRQIREVGTTIGLPVLRIVRVRIGTLELGSLKPKEWRDLSSAEVHRLKVSTLGSKSSSTERKTERAPWKKRTAQNLPAKLEGDTGEKRSEHGSPRPHSSNQSKTSRPGRPSQRQQASRPGGNARPGLRTRRNNQH